MHRLHNSRSVAFVTPPFHGNEAYGTWDVYSVRREKARMMKREETVRQLLSQAAEQLHLRLDVLRFTLFPHEHQEEWRRQAKRIGECDVLVSTAEEETIPLHAVSERNGIPHATVLVLETYQRFREMIDFALASHVRIPNGKGRCEAIQRVFPCVLPHRPLDPKRVRLQTKNALTSALLYPDVPTRDTSGEQRIEMPDDEDLTPRDPRPT